MSYATEHIAKTLREAREKKQLSQRELSALSGLPQSHISKIEKGGVDLRLSSLIALARILDLEPILVPRSTTPAVQSIVTSAQRSAGGSNEETRLALRELKRLQRAIARHSSEAVPAPNELAQLQRQIREIQRFRLSVSELEAIRSASHAFKTYLNDTENAEALRKSLWLLKGLRNALAHGAHATPSETERPAYSLDEDDNA